MRLILVSLVLFCQVSLAGELTDDAYGRVKIGMKADLALQQLKDYYSDRLSYDEPYSCYYLSSNQSKKGVPIMVVDDMVARFDVFDKELGIVVGNGLGVGSNKKEVLAIYPNTIVSPHPYIALEGEYLEVKLNNGNGIIFETDHDIVTSFRLGSYPAVGFIEGCL